jgi:hypothetical protein
MGEGKELCFLTLSHLWGESWREGNSMKILVTGGAGFTQHHLQIRSHFGGYLMFFPNLYLKIS